MLTRESYIEFALLEYRRDSGFRAAVDKVIGELIRAGLLAAGLPLAAILGRDAGGGEPFGKALHRACHSRSTQPQWQRARAQDLAGA
jgi:hypothetical protein